MSEWISVEDRLPDYGEPVLICANDVVQSVTFMRDGFEDTADWFEPYHFGDDDEFLRVWASFVTHWMPLPEPPS